MTRFARSHGSKAANERAPEAASTWQEMSEQLAKKRKEKEEKAERDKFEAMRKKNYQDFLIEQKESAIVPTWCEFDDSSAKSPPVEKPKKSKKSSSAKNNQSIDIDTSKEADVSDASLKKEKKAKRKNSEREDLSAAENFVSHKPKKNKHQDDNIEVDDDTELKKSKKKLNKKQNNETEEIVSDSPTESKKNKQKQEKAKKETLSSEGHGDDSELDVDDEELSKWCDEYSDEEITNQFKSLTSQLEEILAKEEKIQKEKKSIVNKKKRSKSGKNNVEDKKDNLQNENIETGIESDTKESDKINKKLNKKNKFATPNADESKNSNDVKPMKKKKQNELPNDEDSKNLKDSEKLPVLDQSNKKSKKRKIQIEDSDHPEKKMKNIDNDTPSEKNKNVKNEKKTPGEFVRRKPQTEEKTVIYVNGEEVEVVQFGGFPILSKDAERLQDLRKNLISKGIPRSEVDRTLKLERRKAEKSLARIKKKLCFHCRKAGHNLSDCPDLNSKSGDAGLPSSGICFKCGSTEHTHFACRVVKTEDFRFAQCYICKEQGHISKQCPDNPRGLYPKGGGCRECGDVTHLKKDCPKILQLREDYSIKLDTMENDNIEDISSKPVRIEQHTPKVKHVKF